MKKVILAVILTVLASVYVFGQDQIFISISKSSSGELIMTVKGHTTPVNVKINDKEVTIQVNESEVNLTALGINELTEVSVEEVDTAAGSETSTDTQATASPIPPVSPFISPTPPLTTPF